jgi:hypothetical protein
MCEEVSRSGGLFRSAAFSLSDISVRSGGSPCTAPALLSHSPERSHAEPGKCQGEANCNRDAAGGGVPGLVLYTFTDRRDRPERRHENKDRSRDFKPELVQHVSEGARRRSRGLHDRAYGAIASGLPARHPGDGDRLSKDGNLTHRSILAASGATMTQPRRNNEPRVTEVHLIRLAKDLKAPPGGSIGPTTETADEGARRSH